MSNMLLKLSKAGLLLNILLLVHHLVVRFKKCKEVGMTYHNLDDTAVQIPRELFEVRQKELEQISANAPHQKKR